jgi:hypothetical protein
MPRIFSYCGLYHVYTDLAFAKRTFHVELAVDLNVFGVPKKLNLCVRTRVRQTLAAVRAFQDFAFVLQLPTLAPKRCFGHQFRYYTVNNV